MSQCLVTYQGGYPNSPKRMKNVFLLITPESILLIQHDNREQKKVIFDIPISRIESVHFPHSVASDYAFAEKTQVLISQCKFSMVVIANFSEADVAELVFGIDTDYSMPTLFANVQQVLMLYQNAHTQPYEPIKQTHSFSADYVGGHPRVPQPKTNTQIFLAAGAVCVWSSGKLVMQLPFEDIDEVYTQFKQTSGKFFGIGGAGILEASIAAALTRRNHHIAVISTTIDRKSCGIGFNFREESTQMKFYDAIEQLIRSRQEPKVAQIATDNSYDNLSPNSIAEQLRSIADLFTLGLLDEKEFNAAKKKILES